MSEPQFPYKRLRFKDSEISAMFRRLKALYLSERIAFPNSCSIGGLSQSFPLNHSLKLGGKYVQITSRKEDYYDFNQLSDMFVESVRVKARVCTEKYSPFDYFYEFSRRISQECLKRYGTLDDPYFLRETLFILVRECTSFRPAVVRGIISYFNAKKMFDFSAGWGDRLLGAMASDIEYLGLDPNPDLKSPHQEMIRTFGDPNKHSVITECAEEFSPSKKILGTFDLVFTSPPFFDTEIYRVNDFTQSSRFCDETDWLDGFLFPAVDLSVKMLQKSGIFALNLKQKSSNESFISKTFSYISNQYPETMVYVGMISYINERGVNPQPIWIWRKI